MLTEEEIKEATNFLKEMEIEGYKWTAFGREKYIVENVIRRIKNFNIEVTLKDTEINKLKEENERLKYACAKATEIIDEHTNETEMDTKKLIEYQEKHLNNK